MSMFASSMNVDQILTDGNEADDLFNSQVKMGDEFFGKFKIQNWKAQATQNSEYETNPGEQCIDTDGKFNLYEMFEQKQTFTKSFYTYMGSDTKPPCKEDVQWIILKDPYMISSSQKKVIMDKTRVANNDNARKQMPLEDREILSFDECPPFNIPKPVTIPNIDA